MTFQEKLKEPWIALFARLWLTVKWLNFAAALMVLGMLFLVNGWNIVGQAMVIVAMLIPLAIQVLRFAEVVEDVIDDVKDLWK